MIRCDQGSSASVITRKKYRDNPGRTHLPTDMNWSTACEPRPVSRQHTLSIVFKNSAKYERKGSILRPQQVNFNSSIGLQLRQAIIPCSQLFCMRSASLQGHYFTYKTLQGNQPWLLREGNFLAELSTLAHPVSISECDNFPHQHKTPPIWKSSSWLLIPWGSMFVLSDWLESQVDSLPSNQHRSPEFYHFKILSLCSSRLSYNVRSKSRLIPISSVIGCFNAAQWAGGCS